MEIIYTVTKKAEKDIKRYTAAYNVLLEFGVEALEEDDEEPLIDDVETLFEEYKDRRFTLASIEVLEWLDEEDQLEERLDEMILAGYLTKLVTKSTQ